MATETITGAIYYKAPPQAGVSGTYAFCTFDATTAGWTKVVDYSFDFDAAPADIAQYTALKNELTAETSAMTAILDGLISNLTPGP